MAYKLIVKEEAQADAVEAYLYYEGKLGGLGERFLQSLLSKYDQIAQNPEFYSFIDKQNKLRDVSIEGFPYLVVYSIEERQVVIYAIHNSHKKPKHSI